MSKNLARPPPHAIEIGHPCTGDVNAMVWVWMKLYLIVLQGPVDNKGSQWTKIDIQTIIWTGDDPVN